jgi:hypothetical protein
MADFLMQYEREVLPIAELHPTTDQYIRRELIPGLRAAVHDPTVFMRIAAEGRRVCARELVYGAENHEPFDMKASARYRRQAQRFLRRRP